MTGMFAKEVKGETALAWQEGVADIHEHALSRILSRRGGKYGPVEHDELERLHGFTRVERQTLKRLRQDERFGEVLQRIEPHFKNDDDRQNLIASILYSAREALEGPTVFRRSVWSQSKWPKMINHAKALHGIITHEDWICRQQHLQLASLLSQVLEQAKTFKLSVKRDLSHAQYGLSRQYHTFEGQRSTFMSHLSRRIAEIFNEPLDDVVRVLTEIVLDCEATIDQVKGARRFGVNTPTTRSGRSRRR